MDNEHGPSSGLTRHPALTLTRSLEDQIMATRKATRKLTAAETTQQLSATLAENGRLLCALQDIVTGAIDATERTLKSPEGRYTFQLTRAASPCGGLIIATFHYPTQRDSVSVHMADHMLRTETIIRDWDRACWPALERLQVVHATAQAA